MSDSLILSIHDDATPDAPLLTIPGGLGLYRKRVALDLSLTLDKGIVAEARFEECIFRAGSNGDSFLAQLLPGPPDTEPFDIAFHWAQNGFSSAGSAILEIPLP